VAAVAVCPLLSVMRIKATRRSAPATAARKPTTATGRLIRGNRVVLRPGPPRGDVMVGRRWPRLVVAPWGCRLADTPARTFVEDGTGRRSLPSGTAGTDPADVGISATAVASENQAVRTILALALAAAVVAAGCGITSSTSEPVAVAPSLAPGERPVQVLPLEGSVGEAPLTLRIYDRSLALDDARGVTKRELAELEPLSDANAIGSYQSVSGEVMITWLGSACPGTADVFVGPGVSEILIVPADGGECSNGSSVRGVNLVFRPNVDLKRISVSFARPSGS
jgi:hypothetical protein